MGMLGFFTYKVLPAFGFHPRRFSRKLNKAWFETISKLWEHMGGIGDFMNYGYLSKDWHVHDSQESISHVAANMYKYVATSNRHYSLEDKEIIEIGSGRGAGAKLLTKTFSPRSYIGIDLSENQIRYANRHHKYSQLSFLQGDAQNLPVKKEGYDVAINIESSHQYPDYGQFLKEIHRVLRPGGLFMTVDFFFNNDKEDRYEKIAESPLKIQEKEDVTPNVIQALELTSKYKLKAIRDALPRFAHPFASEFAGGEDYPLYEALRGGEKNYVRYVMRKPC